MSEGGKEEKTKGRDLAEGEVEEAVGADAEGRDGLDWQASAGNGEEDLTANSLAATTRLEAVPVGLSEGG